MTEDPHNLQIQDILVTHSSMMTGRIPMYAEDEYDMMIAAINHNYMKDEQVKSRINSAGFSDFFTLPILCLVNRHIASNPDCNLDLIQ